MRKSQLKMWRLEGLLKKGETLQGERNNVWKRWVNRWENVSETRKIKKKRTDSKNTRRLQWNQEHIRHQICEKGYLLITKIENEKSQVITSRKGIAHVFGEIHSKLFHEFRRWDTCPGPTESRLVGCLDRINLDPKIQNQICRHRKPNRRPIDERQFHPWWVKSSSSCVQHHEFFRCSLAAISVQSTFEEDKAGRKTWRKGTCGGEIEEQWWVWCRSLPITLQQHWVRVHLTARGHSEDNTRIQSELVRLDSLRKVRMKTSHRILKCGIRIQIRSPVRGDRQRIPLVQDCLSKVCWPTWECLLECTTKTWSSTGRRYARDRRQRDDLGDIHVRDNEGGSTSWTTLSMRIYVPPRTRTSKRPNSCFDISQKLILNQKDEIFEWNTIPWMRTICSHDKAIKLSKAKVHVYSDSVLCLGKFHEHPHSMELWEG